MYKEIEKLSEETSKYKHYCKCGHSVVIYPFEKKDKKLCNWCGRYVYEDPEKQKKYDFKLKMKTVLQGGVR